MKTIYLIGSPGAGKSTLAKAFKGDLKITGKNTAPVKHETLLSPTGQTITSLGWDKPPFSGTDTLPYTAISAIEAWLPTLNTDILFGEGDRLAVDKFLQLASKQGDLHLFYLNTNPAVATDRRQLRADQNNLKQQNPSWVAGRVTKHRNLADRWSATLIPGNLTPEAAATLIWQSVFP